MKEVPSLDEQYTKELTRRSVARAALHLGIQDMNLETLTVLQDALTQYLERICNVLGNNVEHSGRSSMHVNILDAVRAVEDCIPDGHWVELERFITEDLGGSNKGWSASLDNYDSLIDYPLQSEFKGIEGDKGVMKLANKNINIFSNISDHPISGTASNSKITPEDSSGLLSSKRKRDGGKEADDKSKKSSPAAGKTETTEASFEVKFHPDADYIPNFLPPFPPKRTFIQSVSITNTKNSFHAEAIRSSLVKMGSYWGTMNDNSSNDDGSKKKIEIKVESGTKSAVSTEGIHDREVRKVDDVVKPIARASTARVAKILEGSMGTRT